MWRAPGRRNAEREKFHRLVTKVEAIRLRDGMTKREVCAEIGTHKDVLRSWLSGESIGRARSVAKIKDFLEQKSI
jgi:DNA-binding transcriptional regulator YiaG